MKKNDWRKKKWFAYTVAACAGVTLYMALSNFSAILRGVGAFFSLISPVILGTAVAYVLNPLMKLFETRLFGRLKRREAARAPAVLLTFVAVIVFIVILMVALIPQIVMSVQTLVLNMDMYLSTLQGLLGALDSTATDINLDISGVTEMMNDLAGYITAGITQNAGSIINTSFNIGMAVFNWVVGCILAVYFLLEKEHMVGALKELLRLLMPAGYYEETMSFLTRCNEILIQYIAFDLLDGLIVGLANFIFMSVTRMPFSVLLSVVVGVTNLAPTFGPIVGGALGVFILVLADPWKALWFLIFTLILQTIDGYILKPRLFGGTFGVSSAWILVTLIVGGKLFGVLGILLAIPAAAIIDYAYEMAILPRLKRRREAPAQREAGQEKADRRGPSGPQ